MNSLRVSQADPPVAAALNRRDRADGKTMAFFDDFAGVAFTNWAVVSESWHLLPAHRREGLLTWLKQGGVRIAHVAKECRGHQRLQDCGNLALEALLVAAAGRTAYGVCNAGKPGIAREFGRVAREFGLIGCLAGARDGGERHEKHRLRALRALESFEDDGQTMRWNESSRMKVNLVECAGPEDNWKKAVERRSNPAQRRTRVSAVAGGRRGST